MYSPWYWKEVLYVLLKRCTVRDIEKMYYSTEKMYCTWYWKDVLYVLLKRCTARDIEKMYYSTEKMYWTWYWKGVPVELDEVMEVSTLYSLLRLHEIDSRWNYRSQNIIDLISDIYRKDFIPFLYSCISFKLIKILKSYGKLHINHHPHQTFFSFFLYENETKDNSLKQSFNSKIWIM